MYDSELKEAFAQLMKWRGTNPNKIASEIVRDGIDFTMTQSKVRRVFENADKDGSLDPKPETVRPIAEHFGLELHEIYDLPFVRKYIGFDGSRLKMNDTLSELNEADIINAVELSLLSMSEEGKKRLIKICSESL